MREAVIGAISKHILVPLLGKDYDSQVGLRIYQCHRPAQREVKDYDGKKVVDAVSGEVQMEPYYKISYHILCRDIACDTMATMNALVLFMLAKLNKDGSDASKLVIEAVDASIYSNGRLFRLPHSWKKSKTETHRFQPISLQKDSELSSDCWATANAAACTLKLDMAVLEERLSGFDEWKKKNGKFLKSASGRVANVSKRGGEYLHEAAERVLNEHFNKHGVRYLCRLRRADMAVISADQNDFCMMNPAHQHNEPQSDILIDTTSLCMTIHCFGKDCGTAMLALRSVEDLTVLRLAALSKIPYEVLGEPLADRLLLDLLPASNEQPWRIVRTGDIGNFGQTFIVNPEQIISTYGQQLTVLFKEALEDVEETTVPGDTEMIIVLLNRKALFGRIPANGDIDTTMLDGEEAAKIIKAGQNKCAVTIMRYLRQLFSHKGIRAGRDKTLYQRVPETPMLYKPIHIPSAAGKSPSEKLLIWLNKEVNRYAPPCIREIWEHTNRAGKKDIEHYLETFLGEQIENITSEECYSFRNGILFLPRHATAVLIDSYFEDWATMQREGRKPVLPLRHFDADFNPDWAGVETGRQHFPALIRTFESQGFSREFQDHIVALAVGRPMAKWALLERDEFDGWQVNVFLYGFPGTGKSAFIKMIKSYVPEGWVQAMNEAGRENLGQLEMYRDSKCRLIIGEELHAANLSFFETGFSLSAFNAVATGEALPISILHEGQVTEVINSPVICAANDNSPGWMRTNINTLERGSWIRRLLPVPYRHRPVARDETVERDILSDEQSAAALVYSLQRYFDRRQPGGDDELTLEGIRKIPEVAVERTRMFNENSPVHLYFAWLHEGTDTDKPIPRLVPKNGHYVTPRDFSLTVQQFIKENYPNKWSLKKETLGAEEIMTYVPKVDARFEISYSPTEPNGQSYCMPCFKHGHIRLHEKGGCFHKYCRETRKAIANGSILNAELRVPDDSAMLLAHQR